MSSRKLASWATRPTHWLATSQSIVKESLILYEQSRRWYQATAVEESFVTWIRRAFILQGRSFHPLVDFARSNLCYRCELQAEVLTMIPESHVVRGTYAFQLIFFSQSPLSMENMLNARTHRPPQARETKPMRFHASLVVVLMYLHPYAITCMRHTTSPFESSFTAA